MAAAEECSTDNTCCYTDDSGAETLTIVCVSLAAALVLAVSALAWSLVTNLQKARTIRVGSAFHSRDRKDQAATHGLSQADSRELATGDVTFQEPLSPARKASATTRSGGSPDRAEAISLETEEKDVENGQLLRRMTSHGGVVNGKKVERSADRKGQMSRAGNSKSLDDLEYALRPKITRRNSLSTLRPPSPGSSVGPDTVHRLRVLLDTERSRRMAAESVLGRRANAAQDTASAMHGTRTSLRRFPGPRAIEAHALEAAANAARWAQSATAHAGLKQPELPNLICELLVHAYWTCHAEVTTRLEARIDGLREFLGGEEIVELGAKDGVMAGDTQDLLYGELRRRFQSIGLVGRSKLVSMCRGMLTRALKREESREIGRALLNQTWPTFEPLMKSYLALFVECALQKPAIEFEDTLGKEETYDPAHHRELARILEPEGNTVCIVFPALKASRFLSSEDGTRSDALRNGVVSWSRTKYFQL